MSEQVCDLSICFQDEVLVAVDKPTDMLVHRSGIDAHERIFLLQTLRDQLGQHLFPLHRLDKPTSGLVVFALNTETARAVSQQFETGCVEKTYRAFVRGHTPEHLTIDHPLRDEVDSKGRATKQGVSREAQTVLRTLAHWTVPEPVDRYPEARYSLVELSPLTGRSRQLRRHMKHISHPILGDVRYGKGTHNRFIAERTGIKRLWLHALELRFTHPQTGERLTLSSEMPNAFDTLSAWLNTVQS